MSDRTCNGDYDVKYIETISLDNVSTYQIDSTIVFWHWGIYLSLQLI